MRCRAPGSPSPFPRLHDGRAFPPLGTRTVCLTDLPESWRIPGFLLRLCLLFWGGRLKEDRDPGSRSGLAASPLRERRPLRRRFGARNVSSTVVCASLSPAFRAVATERWTCNLDESGRCGVLGRAFRRRSGMELVQRGDDQLPCTFWGSEDACGAFVQVSRVDHIPDDDSVHVYGSGRRRRPSRARQ